MAPSSKVHVFEDVAKHRNAADCWLILFGKVYDVTSFLEEHPGGPEVKLAANAKDATSDFNDVGHSDSVKQLMRLPSLVNSVRLHRTQSTIQTRPLHL